MVVLLPAVDTGSGRDARSSGGCSTPRSTRSTSLPGTQGEQVLVNQDLHGDNVLSAQREPWLLIDPKPLLAEREFSLVPIIRSAELGHSRKQVLRRLDRLTAELGPGPRTRAAVDARRHDRLGHRRPAVPRRGRPLAS